jgi:hypothetical protein
MQTPSMSILLLAPVVAVVTVLCACSSSASTGVTIAPGTWSYALNSPNGVPLPGNGDPQGCTPPTLSGTMVVASGGAFSIPFAFAACSNCAMSGTITGTIASSGISGDVTASTAGSGCGIGQPTPSPTPITGNCTSTGCIGGLVQSTPGLSFGLNFTLTPP